MALAFDHAFICCAPGAPEGDELIRIGLVEGSPNTHTGQGTANRRFFFRNAMLELLFVRNAEEARNEQTRRTRLWERCTRHASGANPFGIVFRTKDGSDAGAPFATWAYRPSYLPSGLAMQFAIGVPLDEPELIYLPFLRRSGMPANEPIDHALPMRELCAVTLGLPSADRLSAAAKAASTAGLLTYRYEPVPLLELTFVAEQEFIHDLRPVLPLLLRGAVIAA